MVHDEVGVKIDLPFSESCLAFLFSEEQQGYDDDDTNPMGTGMGPRAYIYPAHLNGAGA